MRQIQTQDFLFLTPVSAPSLAADRQRQDFQPFHLRQALTGVSLIALFCAVQKSVSRFLTSLVVSFFTRIHLLPVKG